VRLGTIHGLICLHSLSCSNTPNQLFCFVILFAQLHPDKNRAVEQAQEAYDQVLNAKAMLADDDKANHTRQLAEQGMLQGKSDWERRETSARKESLESFQVKAVQRIFAQVEYNRKEVEKRERNYKQRERQQEDDEVQKERDARTFDKNWKVGERVDKRVGNWRDFATANKKKKT
jgi:septum formation inhibitor MinC